MLISAPGQETAIPWMAEQPVRAVLEILFVQAIKHPNALPSGTLYRSDASAGNLFAIPTKLKLPVRHVAQPPVSSSHHKYNHPSPNVK